MVAAISVPKKGELLPILRVVHMYTKIKYKIWLCLIKCASGPIDYKGNGQRVWLAEAKDVENEMEPWT